MNIVAIQTCLQCNSTISQEDPVLRAPAFQIPLNSNLSQQNRKKRQRFIFAPSAISKSFLKKMFAQL